jgi:peptidoglycan LD-endopeptidase LytH
VKALVAFLAGALAGAAGAVVYLRAGAPTVPPVPQATPPPPVTLPSALPVEPVSPPARAPAAEPSPNAFAPDALAPLGVVRPSPVPGDSADGALTPQMLMPPQQVPLLNLPTVGDLDHLRYRRLQLPVRGFDVRSLRDNFAEARGGRVHEALDLAAPRGTPVLAVDDGIVKKLFTSKPGGLTVYQFDPSQTFSYYYAHLDRYADGLKEGAAVRKGDVLGYVGTTGNAPPGVPHLHFTVFKLDAEKRWWQGTAINPYPLWALR